MLMGDLNSIMFQCINCGDYYVLIWMLCATPANTATGELVYTLVKMNGQTNQATEIMLVRKCKAI